MADEDEDSGDYLDLATQAMCPHCGALVALDSDGLTPYHDWPKPTRQVCPGSKQIPRNPLTDRRSLWNGKPNPHAAGPDNDSCSTDA